MVSRFDSSKLHAVQVGPEILGWVGPDKTGDYIVPEITVLMGDDALHLNITELEMEMRRNPEGYDVDDLVISMMCYKRNPFFVRVPDETLDVSHHENIIFTKRSADMLRVTLWKFFLVLSAEVQADLHTRTPVEVIRRIAELHYYQYPKALINAMTWRGRIMDDIARGTTMEVQIVKRGYPFSSISHEAGTLRKLPGRSMLGSVVEWQTRTAIKTNRKAPINVLHIRAKSSEEFELGKKLFDTPNLLNNYLTTRKHSFDYTFCLSLIGDVLEEWIDGEELSLEEFIQAASPWIPSDLGIEE